jgi:hypothetical protein
MAEAKETQSEPDRLAKTISALSDIEYKRLTDFFEKTGAAPPVCECSCATGAGAKATIVV